MKRTAKSFPVYLDYSKAVNKLSDAEAGQLFKALLEYADSGQDPQLEGSLYAVFAIMQNQLDRDTEKYVQKCERLRQNGSKGGRPVRDKEPNGNQEKPNGYPKKPKKPDTDTDTVTVTDTDTVTDSNIGHKADKPPSRHRFAPPTVEEVRAYCTEKGYTVDPQRFVDYYTSNGWRVGKNPMKDWKAAVRTWIRNDQQRGNVRSTSPLPDYGGEGNWSL